MTFIVINFICLSKRFLNIKLVIATKIITCLSSQISNDMEIQVWTLAEVILFPINYLQYFKMLISISIIKLLDNRICDIIILVLI